MYENLRTALRERQRKLGCVDRVGYAQRGRSKARGEMSVQRPRRGFAVATKQRKVTLATHRKRLPRWGMGATSCQAMPDKYVIQ